MYNEKKNRVDVKILIYLIVIVVGFIAYVRYIEKRTVFLPSIGRLEGVPTEAGMAYEDVFITTDDLVKIHGWFIPAKNNAKDALTFLFFHGNAGNINNRVEKVQLLHELGGNVLVIDYRGYGISEGSPTEVGIYRDAQAAFDYLLERKDIDRRKIIIYGVSLGGAPATDLVKKNQDKIAGLILHSTFTSAQDMAKKILPFVPSFLVQVKLDNLNRIANITVPKLIIHTPQDEVVPYWMGEKLFEQAVEPKEFLRIDGEHNDSHIESREEYLMGMREFLKKYL